ncbi:hypothetical protein AVEN_76173-1 [Araneus ventricosus]|uniref:Uncharacterized protein n=1 Tax=Araneus ventricosus TaxID=182803 RepID=A0A4Y2AWK5_ARAVE|nr:hypothetical protein AVEN_213110-1 [Araneus ventricosus]GBM08208.1 hypothetical protein AVEN_76173-1 [Araneus ventricosus]
MSAVRVIPCRRNRKNRCGSWACKCICWFPRYGGKYCAHQRKVERPDGANASAHSNTAETFSKSRAVGSARLFEFNRPRSTSTILERLEICPSHRPLEHGLMIQSTEKTKNKIIKTIKKTV